MRLSDLAKANLGEGNKYVYLIDEGITEEQFTGRRMSVVSFWRLVLDRPHGEPIFEKVAEVMHLSQEDLLAEVQQTLTTNEWEELEFTDAEFALKTGSELGYVTFDG